MTPTTAASLCITARPPPQNCSYDKCLHDPFISKLNRRQQPRVLRMIWSATNSLKTSKYLLRPHWDLMRSIFHKHLYRPATTPGVRGDQRCVLCRTTEEANSYSKSCTCPLHLIDMTGRMRSCLCRSLSRPFIQLQELKSFMSGIGIEN